MKTKRTLILLLTLALVVAICATIFTACSNDSAPSQTPADDTPNGDSQQGGDTQSLTMAQILGNNPNKINSLGQTLLSQLIDVIDIDNDKIIYFAVDFETSAVSINEVSAYIAYKGEGNGRIYKTLSITFAEITAEQISNNSARILELVVTNVETVAYNIEERQHDTNFLSNLYEHQRTIVIKEYQDEITEYVAQITSTQTLVSEYPAAVDSLSNRISAAIMNKYQYNESDVVFCGCKLPNADSKGMIDSMTIRVARKTGDSERTVCDYRVVFDPVYLDKIADGTATYTNVRSAFESDFKYDAKTADPAAIAEYFEDYDSDYVVYEEEHFEDPVTDITIDEVINNYGDTVNANLEGHYENVLKRAFGGNYGGTRYDIEAYQWDLGEVSNGNVQNLKITLKYHDTQLNNDIIRVYSVNLNQPISLNDLYDSTGELLKNTTASYSSTYSFTYDSSIQGTRSELAVAILQNAGIDASAVDYIIKDNGSSTNSDLGTIRKFVVSVCDGASIMEVAATIQSASSDAELIAKLQSGKGYTNSSVQANFSQNMLELVDLGQEASL